jgi:hypothetical protein
VPAAASDAFLAEVYHDSAERHTVDRKEWLNLGIWGRREEARKSWSHILSDVTIYACDVLPREFQRHTLGGIEWISKYQTGNTWLEYHGVLAGERPANFHAIIEVATDSTPGLYVNIGCDSAGGRESVLIDIAKFIKLPEGMVPIGIPSVVRLKVFDDLHSITGHIPDDSSELVLATSGRPFAINREHHISGGTRISDKRQLPSELVKARAQRIDKHRRG